MTITMRGDGASSAVAICGAFMFCVSLGFNIAAIVVAVQEADDPCQGTDKTHISLHEWLLITGIVGLCVTIVVTASFCGMFAMEWEACGCLGLSVIALNSLFIIAWFVLGIVLVARSNSSCVDDSTSLGVMSVIMLVIQGLGVWGICCVQSGTK